MLYQARWTDRALVVVIVVVVIVVVGYRRLLCVPLPDQYVGSVHGGLAVFLTAAVIVVCFSLRLFPPYPMYTSIHLSLPSHSEKRIGCMFFAVHTTQVYTYINQYTSTV